MTRPRWEHAAIARWREDDHARVAHRPHAQRDHHGPFGPLTIRVASRQDLITLKLWAATDVRLGQRREVDVLDLRELAPTTDELRAAAYWCTLKDGRTASCDTVTVLAKNRERRRSPRAIDPDDVIAECVVPSARDHIAFIHEVNPTGAAVGNLMARLSGARWKSTRRPPTA